MSENLKLLVNILMAVAAVAFYAIEGPLTGIAYVILIALLEILAELKKMNRGGE